MVNTNQSTRSTFCAMMPMTFIKGFGIQPSGILSNLVLPDPAFGRGLFT
jgi:hypothetical protein